MNSRLFILVGSCVLVVGSHRTAVAQTAPLEFVGGRPVVSVFVNAKGPYRFLLDTGASGNVIAENVARAAGLEQIGESRVASPAVASANVKSVPIFRIDSAEIGSIAITGTRAASLTMPAVPGAPPLDGVLSPAAFAGRLLTIDYPKAQVRVEAGALPSADGRTIFQYGDGDRLPVVPLDVAGKTLGVHMDSGSPGGITLPIERAAELKLKGAPVPSRKGRTIDAEFQMYAATLDGVVKLGAYTLGSDLEFAERAPRGRLGGAVLKSFVVTLDVANRRVRLEPGSASVSPSAAPTPQTAPQTRAEPASTLSLPAAGVDVPLRLVGGRPLVSVQVNGKGPYTFLLDTGAAGQARADTSLVEALKLEVIGEARGAAGPGGQAVSMPIVRFDTLEIGGASISAVSAPSRDYNTGKDTRIDGILGLNLFRDCLVTLDFERGRLRLERGSLPDPDGREVFPFTNPRGIAELSIRVGDTDVLADVDTGAMGGITVPLSLAATLSLSSPPAVVGRAVTVSGPMEISAAPLKGAVTIGRHAIADPTLEFTPALPHGNLGIDLLSQFAITFDQQNRRLRLSRSSNEPIRLTTHR